MKETSSSTSKTIEYLMLAETKMLKDNQSLFTRDMVVLTRDGRSSILIRLKMSKMKDMKRTSDSTSTDHSISDQDFQCKELQNAQETEHSSRRDIERMPSNNSLSSMESARHLRTSTGNNGQFRSLEMVVQQLSNVQTPTQDGGRCGEEMELSLPTKKERS
jgi:DNA-binding transcriptional regulator YiaG